MVAFSHQRYSDDDRLRRTRFPVPQQGADQSSTADYEELSYDPAGNVVSRRLRDGNVFAFQHDALGRMTYADNPLSATSVMNTDVSLSYDNLGRLTQAIDNNGHLARFTYDALGRTTSEESLNGGVKTMQYDLAGRLTRLAWPDGFAVGYAYNALGEMTGIRENPQGANLLLASFSYDDLGRRTALVRGNGASTVYGYDPVSRLVHIGHEMARPGQGPGSHSAFSYYERNPAGQIAGLTRTDDSMAFAVAAPSTTVDTHDGLNRIVASGGTPALHDARGNMVAIGATTYGYNLRNQLTTRAGLEQLYYEPLGRLTQQWNGAGTFDWVGSTLIGELSGHAQYARRTVHGPGIDEPLVAYENGQRRWLHADDRGSISCCGRGSAWRNGPRSPGAGRLRSGPGLRANGCRRRRPGW